MFLARFRFTAGVLTVAAAGILCSPHFAEAQTIALDTIVVEGTSLDFSPQTLASTGSAVTVVTGEQLQQQQVRHAGDALRSLPGVHVGRTGAFGGLTEVRLRGAESNHTLVLIDGVEANATTNGLFSFSDLAVENIERIEVIRGAQSGLFGSSALAGVINIVTRKGQGPLTATVQHQQGSFDTKDDAASISGGNDFMHGSLTFHRQKSGGFNVAPVGEEEDGSEHSSAIFKGGVSPARNLAFDVMVRRAEKRGGRDNEGGTAGTLAVQVDTPSHFATDLLLANAAATWTTFGGALVHRFHGDINETDREDTDATAFGTFFSRNDSRTRHVRYTGTLKRETPGIARGKHKLTGMIEREVEEFTPVTADNIKRTRKAESVAADYHGEFFDHLAIHGAVRHDDNDTLEDFTTYRVAGSLKVPGTPVRVHASAGTGVKIPNMFEQFGFIPASFVPNPNLMPEESFSWDAGAEITLFGGRLILDATWFEANLENEIATVFLPGFRSTPVNLTGISQRSGLELAGRAKVARNVTVGGSYTHLNATEPSGLVEIRRPEHSGQADINLAFAEGRGNLNARVAYNGEMTDQAFLLPLFTVNRVILDDYTLVSVAGSFEVTPGVELFGRVENLLDEDYQELFGFATPGLNAYGGIRVKLGVGDDR